MPWNEVCPVRVYNYDFSSQERLELQQLPLEALRAYYHTESTDQYAASAPFTSEIQNFFPRFGIISFGV